MVTTAASVETLVLVLSLLKIIAIVLPVKDPDNLSRTCPDLMVCLYENALATSLVSSKGLRSAIESRCRGAKGEFGNGEEENVL